MNVDDDDDDNDEQVSVPCSSLFDIVTVRCGHCTNLWSVNMAAAFQSLSWQDVQVTLKNPKNPIFLLSLSLSLSLYLGHNFATFLRKSK